MSFFCAVDLRMCTFHMEPICGFSDMLSVPPRHLSLNAFFIRPPPTLPEHLFGSNHLCMGRLALVGRSLGWTLFRIAKPVYEGTLWFKGNT